MERMVRICSHGAAHGVWKEMATVAVGGRELMCEWKSESLVISVTVDMMVALGRGIRSGEGSEVMRLHH